MAQFDENLLGGNIAYSLNQISKMRVKIREKGTYNWITIYEVPINSVEDFYFDRYYKYCASKKTYEIAIIPVINNIEGNLNINEIYSEFSGLFIVDKSNSFSTVLETSISTQKNRQTNYIQTINRKYPYVFSVGENNFYTGNISTTFVSSNSNLCKNNDFVELLSESWKYRDSLFEFLGNGDTKIIKYFDGRIWMSNIMSISENSGDHQYLPNISFDFVESGSCLSSNDLYNNNFIDVNIEGS